MTTPKPPVPVSSHNGHYACAEHGDQAADSTTKTGPRCAICDGVRLCPHGAKPKLFSEATTIDRTAFSWSAVHNCPTCYAEVEARNAENRARAAAERSRRELEQAMDAR